MHARRVAGRRIGVEREGRAVVEHRRAVGECADPQLRPLQVDQDADRPAVLASPPRGSRATSSRMRSCEVWLMLMRNTSAPASNSLRDHLGVAGGGAERGDDLGAAQASHRVGLPRQLRRSLPAGRRQHRRARRAAAAAALLSPVSVSCTVQARCSPVSTSKKPVRS